QCSRIFTGAPIPAGADTVIRQEDTDLGEPEVSIVSDRDCLANLRQAGEDIPQGAVVFEPGTELRPAHLGVLASLAVTHPLVWRRPRVGIAASGDELARLDQPDLILRGERIASSNSYTLAALIREAGGEPVDLGLAADTPESIRAQLDRAPECDFVITSAGISVGEHDHLRGVIESMGGQIDFWRLRMRPGAPVGFGLLGAVPWLGLPGNPVSTMVTFELFGRAAIRVLMGNRLPFREAIRVRTDSPITLGPVLQHFLRVNLSGNPVLPTARITGSQGSGVLTSMARADALLMVPEGQHETPAGAELLAIRLDEPSHRADPAF
ncbi:MAG: molybdopterin molybdotransferase MoeA, partial [Gemmatimonadales bacterium]